MAEKDVLRRDGSGRGRRLNRDKGVAIPHKTWEGRGKMIEMDGKTVISSKEYEYIANGCIIFHDVLKIYRSGKIMWNNDGKGWKEVKTDEELREGLRRML